MENCGALCPQDCGGFCFGKRNTKVQGSLRLLSWPKRKGVGVAQSRELWLKTAACKSKAATPVKHSCCYNDPAGMMGSSKTTVGKVLSEALGYYFFDSDKLVKEAVGGVSVAQIFKEYSED